MNSPSTTVRSRESFPLRSRTERFLPPQDLTSTKPCLPTKECAPLRLLVLRRIRQGRHLETWRNWTPSSRAGVTSDGENQETKFASSAFTTLPSNDRFRGPLSSASDPKPPLRRVPRISRPMHLAHASHRSTSSKNSRIDAVDFLPGIDL